MSRMRSNLISQYGLQIAKYIFPFVTLPYLTRVLGPDHYAVRAYIMSVMSFMQVFLDYGFSLSGTKTVAENEHNLPKLRENISCVMILRILLYIVGAAIIIGLTCFLPIMRENPLYTAIAYISICFKAGLPDFVFQGLEDMGIITQRFVGSQTIAMILTFVLIHKPSDLILVPTIEAIASFIAFIWSWDNVVRVRKIYFTKVSKTALWQAFKDSSIFFLSYAATTALSTATTIMIGIYIPNRAEISYWSLAITIIGAIQSLYEPITNILYPHIVKSHDIKLFKKLLGLGMIVVVIGTVLFAACAKIIMLLLGGSKYLAGSSVMVSLAPMLLFSYPAMMIGFPLLGAVGRIKLLTLSSVVTSAFHIIGLFVLGFSGFFNITTLAILRCCTEGVLFITRFFMAKDILFQKKGSN
ncbi:oligosaccharide flippase family protein [Bifidobacterium sp. ESL0784]|uniref:oligosaccharide flippase family protein n=1 Tax=Bifidobacterium sp. ESL0784 TaxID=2983231 RepID=UPI0023F864FA|nr:oligosaccharide flippase family protein [Bifidobacterium sp. ESL0784]MDF7640329.1 oligosaccharide flippase family protein [Bifidobacterium sp. ESL0784]